MPLSEFWCLTPWLFEQCIEGYKSRKDAEHDNAVFAWWHNALLSGASGKSFPAIEKFMINPPRKKAVKGVDEGAIMDWLKTYSRERERRGG